MSIEAISKFIGYDLTCEACDQVERLHMDRENLRAAFAEAEARGWRAYQDANREWCHVCPDCLKKLGRRTYGGKEKP
jgi:hypothetical protein